MSDRPLVSIIVPVYGTEPYLPRCIESIMRQSYRCIEIILIDDQSPDGCPQICDSYAQRDHRIVAVHQENKGVCGARNTGLKRAKGEYILFVDSDDELHDNAVEVLLADREQYDADIVSGIKTIVSPDGRRSHHESTDEQYTVYRGDAALLLSLNGDSNTNSACSKLFRKSFIENILFVEGKNVHEDGFFVFQCYARRPVLVQHNIPVYSYHLRADSNSRQRFSDKYLAMLYFCEQKNRIILEQFPQYTDQAHNMEVRVNLQLLDLLCRTADRQYREVQSRCIKTVRRLYRYHRPINRHHQMLARIVRFGLYPVYKRAVRAKYFR